MTLPDTMVALAVGSVMLGGLMVTSVSLQEWFQNADYLIACQQDEATALDYIARDIRRASAVAVANGGLRLNLTEPDQTSRATDHTLLAPAITSWQVAYGTQPTTVSYYVQGNAFLRQDAAGTLTLSTNVDRFAVDASRPPAVTLTLLFQPGPRRSAGVQYVTTVRQRNLSGHLQ